MLPSSNDNNKRDQQQFMVLFEMGKVYPKQEKLCFQVLCWDISSKSKVTTENYSCDHHNKQEIYVTLLLFVFI